MDLHSHPQGEHGRFEQILNQFLLKSLHIILDSRVPANRPSSRNGEVKKSDKWFNLVLGDRPSAMESLSFWNRSLMEPIVIDIILVQRSPNSSFSLDSPNSLASEIFTETVVERWIVQYEHQRPTSPQINDTLSHKKIYKKSIILLRTVYSTLRLLPAYKAFRKLCSLNQNCGFDINYKVSSFSDPFSRTDDSMRKYNFYPVDAPNGRLSISVMYSDDLSEFNLDSFVSFPPEIIPDYVGSPLTDPMRVFSSKGSFATSLPIRGRPSPSSSSSSSSLPFQAPHSWTSGLQKELSSRQNQQFSGSPPLHRSPYDYSSSPTELIGHRIPNQRFSAYQKSSCDELLSPPFSSSPSPSPPTYTSRRSETAPVSIPHPMMGRSPKYLSPNLSDPNRLSLPPLSPRNTKQDLSSHESPSGIRLIRRPDLLRSGESAPGPMNFGQKVSRDAKEDSGRFSSLLSSSSSPRVGFSRSSSRLSFQDDFGDCDFSCPFIVDDVDPPDCQTSQNLDGRNSSDLSSQSSSTAKRSQDAAVGELIHMLKTAPPLRQDSSLYTSRDSKIELEAASEFFIPRKTSDALEELKAYREMKHILLSKSDVQGKI